MGKKTEAIFALDSTKKHSALFREEGQTGDWQTDPKAKLSSSIYIVHSALSHPTPKKVKITVEEID
jgi:hypothetical protein